MCVQFVKDSYYDVLNFLFMCNILTAHRTYMYDGTERLTRNNEEKIVLRRKLFISIYFAKKISLWKN